MDAVTLNRDVHPDVAARIIAAADELFSESGKSTIPNVDTVRRKARVDMNDASKVMRAWRKAQSAAAPVADAIPNQICDAGQVLMHALWRQATELANRSLAAAQAGWEADRAEAEGLRAQLAAAFDEQSAEMQKLQTAIRDTLAENDVLRRRAQADASEQDRLSSQAEAMTKEASNARDRCADLQRHIDDMRTALARAQDQAGLFHAEGTRAAGIAAAEIAGLNAELLRGAERLAAAREEVAGLRTEVSLMEQQQLTRRLPEDSGTSSAAAKPDAVPQSTRGIKGRGNGNASR